jgi:hypothetical protein
MRNDLLILIAVLSGSAVMAQSSSPTNVPKYNSERIPPMKGTVTINSCAAYGPGFVKVEGTDTCLQIGGSLGIGVGGATGGRR